MSHSAVLDIIASGAWNGGTPVDNSIYENSGMLFKGGIPVTGRTIEERIGVRTRMAAPADERIGVIALRNLLDTSAIDPRRIKLIIGATNVGDDKYEHGPLVTHPFETLFPLCPDAVALDLYAGCPGFNVSVELAFLLSLTGQLQKGDLTVIIGAENIHRSKAFQSNDTANIIFGDDALATALETQTTREKEEAETVSRSITLPYTTDFIQAIAAQIFTLNENRPPDGIIVDNQMGKVQYRVPATAARIQHRLAELAFPEASAGGVFNKFADALAFYERHIDSFGYDIMTLSRDRSIVADIARAYAASGKYRTVAAVFLKPQGLIEISIHQAEARPFTRPKSGVIDTITRTHGCFAEYIHAILTEDDVFGEMDGKGVFLYATRSAPQQLGKLLTANRLTIDDVELLIEHQANFAMIPLTLAQVLKNADPPAQTTVEDFVADRMVTNIHTRGNCSVVCMQRLPYDLQRGALQPDSIQGFDVNRNTDRLLQARLVLYDSVGAGMTRSSFLWRR
jgi:3-oxoacyl-[acyl-carrier-protein] synthase III